MLAGKTRVLSVYEGAISIADIINRDRKEVLLYSFDDETKLPALARIEEIIETSEDNVYDVEFDSGLKVLCSQTQEFLTF